MLKVLATEGLEKKAKVRRGAYVTEVNEKDLDDVYHLLGLLNRHNSLLKSGRIGESLAEHRAIMQALAARDATLPRSACVSISRMGL